MATFLELNNGGVNLTHIREWDFHFPDDPICRPYCIVVFADGNTRTLFGDDMQAFKRWMSEHAWQTKHPAEHALPPHRSFKESLLDALEGIR